MPINFSIIMSVCTNESCMNGISTQNINFSSSMMPIDGNYNEITTSSNECTHSFTWFFSLVLTNRNTNQTFVYDFISSCILFHWWRTEKESEKKVGISICILFEWRFWFGSCSKWIHLRFNRFDLTGKKILIWYLFRCAVQTVQTENNNIVNHHILCFSLLLLLISL